MLFTPKDGESNVSLTVQLVFEDEDEVCDQSVWSFFVLSLLRVLTKSA